MDSSGVQVLDELAFASKYPEVLKGRLALDPAALEAPGGVAAAIKAFADFDA